LIEKFLKKTCWIQISGTIRFEYYSENEICACVSQITYCSSQSLLTGEKNVSTFNLHYII